MSALTLMLLEIRNPMKSIKSRVQSIRLTWNTQNIDLKLWNKQLEPDYNHHLYSSQRPILSSLVRSRAKFPPLLSRALYPQIGRDVCRRTLRPELARLLAHSDYGVGCWWDTGARWIAALVTSYKCRRCRDADINYRCGNGPQREREKAELWMYVFSL